MNSLPSFIPTLSAVIFIILGLAWAICIASGQEAPAPAGGPRITFGFPDLDITTATEAIRLAENTRRDHIGRAGERSEYQIMPDIWHRLSPKPLWWASSSSSECIAEQKRVAEQHCRNLVHALRKAKHIPHPYILGVAWTAGVHALLTNDVSLRKRAYALRVENLYFDLQHQAAK